MPDVDAANGAPAGGENGAGGTADKPVDAGNGTADKPVDGAGDGSGDGAGAGDGNGDDDKGDEFADDGAEPVTRKKMTAKDHIIARKNKQLEKAKAAKADGDGAGAGEGDGGGDDDGAGDGGDDDLTPEEAKLVEKIVDKKLAPFTEAQRAAEDKAEVAGFIKENPDFAPFEAKVLRYMKHPSRAHLPVQSVFYEVAGPALLKIGAKRQKEAEAEARQTRGGGGSARATGGEKSVNEMTPAEFQAFQDTVRRKRS